MTATAAIIGRHDGPSSVHSIDSARGAGGPQQVGDEVDRAGRQHDAVRRRPARARASSARRGSASTRARRRPAELAHSDAASPAAARAGWRSRCRRPASHERQQLAQHRRRRPCRRGSRCTRRGAARRGSRAATRPARPCRRGCGRRRGRVSGSLARRPRSGPGPSVDAAAARTAPSSSAPRYASAAARASAKLRRWKAPRASTSRPAGSAGRHDQPRAALGARRCGHAPARRDAGRRPPPASRRRDDVELLARDVGAPSARASACAPGRRWSAPARARG